MSFLSHLENSIPTLPSQERKVAMLIAQEPKRVQTLSISELAKLAHVSNATITRFSKRLNCKNFAELKLNLASSTNVAPSEPKVKVKKETPHRVYDFYNRVLKETSQKLDINQLKKIVKLIKISSRVYIFGIGSSGYTAQEMSQRMLRMGISTFPMTESSIMYMTSSIMDSNDLILAISSTGNTTEIVNAAKLGKKRGAMVVAITGIEDSPLAKLSDIVVAVRNTDFINDARFINSQFSIMYAIDVITTMLLDDPKYREHMTQTIDTILNRKIGKNNKRQKSKNIFRSLRK